MHGILHYNNCYSIATNSDPIYDLISNFHAKISTRLFRTGIIIIIANKSFSSYLSKLQLMVLIFQQVFYVHVLMPLKSKFFQHMKW